MKDRELGEAFEKRKKPYLRGTRKKSYTLKAHIVLYDA